MQTVSENLSHGGVQGVYKHQSATTGCEMTFAVFMPPSDGQKVPVLW